MKPRLLDLFCGAGGAGQGYQRAGFEVTGVDIRVQKHCPFEVVQGDALVHGLRWAKHFDAIHASPPCQPYSDLRHMWNAHQQEGMIDEVRDMLQSTERRWIIENVEGSPLLSPVLLCGTMFGLGTGNAELWRHRLFELSWGHVLTPRCQHRLKPRVIGVYGGHGRDRRRKLDVQDFSVAERREAMGIDWMSGCELSQAIPPAYTEFLGRELIRRL